MPSKRTERGASSRPARKAAPKIKFDPLPDDFGDPIEIPLTLRNVRLGIAGRLGRPYTQEAFSKLVKISRTHLTNVETGRVNASQFLLLRISEKLKLDLQVVREAYAGSRAKLDREPPPSKRNPP